MRYDVRKEHFELAEIDGVQGLFTNIRIDKNAVTPDLYFYEIREEDGQSGVAATLEKGVMVNFLGTFLSKTEFPLENGYYEIKGEDMDYLGESYTIVDYLHMNNIEPEEESDINRSEERRVGKECRSRWSPYH